MTAGTNDVQRMPQVAVVAGGEGVRLRPLTEDIPKPMIPVSGKPFLEYLLIMLRRHNFRSIVICTGYLGEQIKSHFSDGGKFDLEISYSEEKELMGTGGALKLAEDLLEDTFFVMWGDNYLELNFLEMQERFHHYGKLGMISVYPNREKRVNHNVLVNENNDIMIYNKSHESAEMNGVEAGVSIFNKKFLDHIPENEKVSLEVQVYPKLISDRQLKGYWCETKYYDIGTFERLKIFEEVIK